jgi:aminoglycoside 3-N-acetyltransferase
MAHSFSRFVAPLRKRIGKFRRRIRTLVARHRCPLDEDQIESELRNLLSNSPEILVVHSSLSACGYISGGPEAVIRAIERTTQNVVMPTHTYCYPRGRGGEPPIFDPRTTPSRAGRITDVFWRQANSLRSVHPTHSLAARGPLAEEIIRDHQACETPCGRGSPYERLLRMDAAALMFGATMFSYTFFHTAEDAAHCPYAYEPEPCLLRFVAADGSVIEMRSLKQSLDDRTFQQMDRPLQDAGLLQRQQLGRGELLFIPNTAAVHEFLLERFAEDPYYLAAKMRRN